MLQSATAERSLRYPGWRVVLAAYFGTMGGFGSLLVFTFSLFVKPLSAQFGWGREAISAAFGCAALSIAAASPTLGFLLDRFGPRRIILPCVAVFGIAFGSLAFLTPNIYHLYAVFVVLGLVGNGTSQLGFAQAVSSWFSERRGFALAVVMAGTGTGAIVLPLLIRHLLEVEGWRAAFMVLGGLSLALGIPLTAIFVRRKPAAEANFHEKETQTGATVAETLATRAFWIIVASLFLGSVSLNGAITHLSALLTDRGLSTGNAAWAVSSLGGASLLGRLITGYFLDRFFGPRVAFSLTVLAGLGMLMMAHANSFATAAAASMLIGLGLGGEADVTPYLLTRYFGLRSFSTTYGLTWTFYALAAAIGPVLMGKAFDATGSYSALVDRLAAVMLLSSPLMLLMSRYAEPVRIPESVEAGCAGQVAGLKS